MFIKKFTIILSSIFNKFILSTLIIVGMLFAFAIPSSAFGRIDIERISREAFPYRFYAELGIENNDSVSVSSDGRYVVFSSKSQDILSESLPNYGMANIYMFDNQEEILTLITRNSSGTGN